jgi:hypothetical protein
METIKKSAGLGFRHFLFAGVLLQFLITPFIILAGGIALSFLSSSPISMMDYSIFYIIGIFPCVYFSGKVIRKSQYYSLAEANKIVWISTIWFLFNNFLLLYPLLLLKYDQATAFPLVFIAVFVFYLSSEKCFMAGVYDSSLTSTSGSLIRTWAKVRLVFLSIAVIVLVLDITTQYKPLDPQTLNKNDGYYLVSNILGKKSIYFLREGQSLGGGDWKEHGSFYKVPVVDADPSTFKVLNYNYAVDKNNAYVGTQKINGADAATFQIIKDLDLIAKDKNRVYLGDRVLNASPQDFRIISKQDSGYEDSYFAVSKDKVILIVTTDNSVGSVSMPVGLTVYGHKTYDIDTETFEVIGPHSKLMQSNSIIYAKDRNHVYSIDVSMCKHYSESGCKYLTVVEGVDPTTFDRNSDIETLRSF